VTLPVPPGFTVDPDWLARLRKVGGVSRVEDHDDSIAVYLLQLSAGEEVELRYRLEAQAECDVLQRPALAYAYYTPDTRGTSKAMRLRATAGPARTREPTTAAAGPFDRTRSRSPAASVWW
jgi:CD109 antigen